MADLNCFSFTGRLSKDAQYKTLASGKSVLEMNVACNTGFGDYAKTTWLNVKMWGDKGSKIAQYLTTGTQIAASGELTNEEWTDKEGNKRSNLVVTIMNVNMVGGKQAQQSEEPPSNSSDIPF